MSHTPIPQGHQQKSTPSLSRPNTSITNHNPNNSNGGGDQISGGGGNGAGAGGSALDLNNRMSNMSIGNMPAPSSNDQDPYNSGILRPLLSQHQTHHSTLPSLSHSQTHSFSSPLAHMTTAPGAAFGYQDFATPYWAATGPQSNAGSAPPSAGPHMGGFGLPFTPSEASPATATFPYGSTIEYGAHPGGGGYDAFHTQHHQQQHQQHHQQQQPQTPADIYATGQQDTRHGGGFGLSASSNLRGRGRFDGQQQVQQQNHQTHQTGWGPHDILDGSMGNHGGGGGGRLSDPATAPYYGIPGPRYGMYSPQIQPQDNRRKPVSAFQLDLRLQSHNQSWGLLDLRLIEAIMIYRQY